MRFGLSEAVLSDVSGILKKHVPAAAIWVFGSRAKGHAKPHSDLDLAIDAGQTLSLETLASLHYDFASSDLPIKVDALDYQDMDASFRQLVDKQRVSFLE